MRTPIIYVFAGTVLGLLTIWYFKTKFALQKGDVITCVGFLFLLASAILLYFQVKSGISLERRRTTHEFMHGPVVQVLLPLETELKKLLNQPTLMFERETTVKTILESQNFGRVQAVLIDILNFYERTAIALRSAVLDDYMLYDDKGAVLLSVYAWSLPLIEDLKKRYEPRAYANLSALVVHWQRRYDKSVLHRSRSEEKRLDSIALPRRDFFS